MPFSNSPFQFWDQFNQIKVFPLFWTILDSSSNSVWSRKFACSGKKMFFLSNLVPRVPFFYIQKKSRLKNRDTTHQLWEVSIDIQKKIIDSFTLVYIRLYSSTFVQAHLVALLHSSTFVHALLYSSVFLEQILFHIFTQSIKFCTFYYCVLRVQMFWKMWFIK